MIFKQIDAILTGEKWMTRRAKKEGEWDYSAPGSDVIEYVYTVNPNSDSTRIKWAVGRTYAIVPKRGAKGIGQRIRITALRSERLGDITEADAIAEGVKSVEAYKALWISINGKWDAETRVWVIAFELVEGQS